MIGRLATRPRIAIPTPTSVDLVYNRTCLPQYIRAVEQAGGTAVEIPLRVSFREQQALVASCAGVLLPGSPADVRPERYGQRREAATAAEDVLREETDTLLLDQADSSRKPVLGVCYGLQSINVWRGGTLLQDLTVMPVNHPAGAAIAVAHAVAIDQDSTLFSLMGEETSTGTGQLRIPVNSSHHQAAGIVGEGLKVTARCPQDAVVEALEGSSASSAGLLLAVQWHPERSYATSALSRALFDWLVRRTVRP